MWCRINEWPFYISLSNEQNDVSAKKEKLQAEITKKDETIRKLESKLDEYSLLLKEAVRDKEKSQLLSDKHQEGMQWHIIVSYTFTPFYLCKNIFLRMNI